MSYLSFSTSTLFFLFYIILKEIFKKGVIIVWTLLAYSEQNWPFSVELCHHNWPKLLFCAFDIIIYSEALKNCKGTWLTLIGPRQLHFEFLFYFE